jgi:hypothetical protein
MTTARIAAPPRREVVTVSEERISGAMPEPETEAEAQTPKSGDGVRGLVREHPWITGIMCLGIVGGGLAGPWLFDEDWSLLRQVAAGAFGGAWVGITITVTKMIGD